MNCIAVLRGYTSTLRYRDSRVQWNFSVHAGSDLVRDRLQPQELVEAPAAVEAAPSAHLRTTVWQVGLVMDGHGVDMNGSMSQSAHFALVTSARKLKATYPLSICFAIRRPRPRFSVKTALVSP
jgi:hypothetical protein